MSKKTTEHLPVMTKEKFIIVDWANNILFNEKEFKSFEDAWDFILENVHEETEDDGTYDDYYVILKSEK